MPTHQVRFERLELKFLIDEITAARVREQIEPYCIPDKHSSEPAQGRAGQAGYPLESLYLDTPRLAFHRAKERGDPDRIKLRIRTYAGSPLASLEVKRRHSNIIDKTRALLDRSQVEEAARGFAMGGGVGVGVGVGHEHLRDFANVCAASGAGPTLTVRYEREAYESVVDHYARVTFDRDIEAQPTDNWRLEPDPLGWCKFSDYWRTELATTPVVLEIKCETAIPYWIADLIRSIQLEQTSFSKYSIGIALTQNELGHRRAHSRSLEALA